MFISPPVWRNLWGGYDGVYIDLRQTEFSITHIVFTLFRWLGQIGDTLFIASSAWFLCKNQKIRWSKIARMVFDTWIISIIGLFLATMFMKPSFSEIIKSVFPIRYEVNWFVGCYIIYYLLHPLINKAFCDFNELQLRKVAIALFVVYCAFGSIKQAYYYTNLVGFICIHLFVMYYRNYIYSKQENFLSKKAKTVALLSFFGIVVWSILINYLGTFSNYFGKNNLLFCTFMNPLIIIFAIASLHIAVSTKEFSLRSINNITRYSLIIYLIHANHFWLTYGKYRMIGILQEYGATSFVAVIILMGMYMLFTPILSYVYDRVFGEKCDYIIKRIRL